MVSPDGLVWPRFAPDFYAVTSLAFIQGRFIITTGYGQIYDSTDGRSWNKKYEAGNRLSSVAFGNGRYVAVGYGISTSTNGLDWKIQFRDLLFRDVVFGENRFVVVGVDGVGGIILTSEDGYIWEYTRYEPNERFDNIAYLSGVFVASGFQYFPNQPLGGYPALFVSQMPSTGR